MNSNMFGPSGWVVLHIGTDIAVRSGFTIEQYNLFVNRLHWALSCVYCRDSFARFRQLVPMPQKPEQWPQWVVQQHNLVNEKLGHTLWRPNKPHPYRRSEFLPALLDFLYTAAYNVPTISEPIRRKDRVEALIGFVQIVVTFTRSKIDNVVQDIEVADDDTLFSIVVRWVDQNVMEQVLTPDTIREAYRYRRARSKTCTSDVSDGTSTSCE